MRAIAEIFADIEGLCRQPGYLHALAWITHADTSVRYETELTTDAFARTRSPDRLIRTEIAVLLGLAISQRDQEFPGPAAMEVFIKRSYGLCKELHEAIADPMKQDIRRRIAGEEGASLGEVTREAIFYGTEAGIPFQYEEFAAAKYAADSGWLRVRLGFDISDAARVLRTIADIIDSRTSEMMGFFRTTHPDTWTVLPFRTVSIEKLKFESGLDPTIVDAVLSQFVLRLGDSNDSFDSLSSMNWVNARPLVQAKPGELTAFHPHSVFAALYESPFFWMRGDLYWPTAQKNRGDFVEEFARVRLARIFRVGVRRGVFVRRGKNRIGDIDVLLVHCGVALIVQAKSKTLTMVARSGDGDAVVVDFEAAVVAAFNQARVCAAALRDPSCILEDASGARIEICPIREVHVLCLVADHFPALNFLTHALLKIEEGDPKPVVVETFTFDILCEFLSTPALFLAYVRWRAARFESVNSANETAVAGMFLSGLPLDDGAFTWLTDDYAEPIDVAFIVRRMGLPGNPNPPGLLTAAAGTVLGAALLRLGMSSAVVEFELASFLYSLGSERLARLAKAVEALFGRSLSDGLLHDISLGVDVLDAGITIHVSADTEIIAQPRLYDLCERSKCRTKAGRWFGLHLRVPDGLPTFAFELDHSWTFSAVLAATIKSAPALTRGSPCICGSGRKYKRCCGAR